MQILISYSHRDIKAAQILKLALEKHGGVRVWLDKHELAFGDQIAERIKNEIARSDLVVVVLTPDSAHSAWVNWEIDCCRAYESLYKVNKLVPILMRGNAIPATIFGRNYADFRTSARMNENFLQLIKQVVKGKGLRPLEEQPIAYDRLNEEILSAPEQILVTAPIIGTVYLAPSEWSKPFVSIGSKVRADDVVVIIEAMKLMTEIQAECEGIVADILVENGQPVEYGQPMILLSASEIV